MPLIAFAGTIGSQILIAYIYMIYFAKDGDSLLHSLAIVALIQLLVWGFYSVFTWANYIALGKKELINHYWHVFISTKFPRIYTIDGNIVDPQEYLKIIYSNETFNDRLRLVACSMHTEISALDKLSHFQHKWRLKFALKSAVIKYFNSKIASECYQMLGNKPNKVK